MQHGCLKKKWKILEGNSLRSYRLEKGNKNGGKYQVLHITDDFIFRVIPVTFNSKQIRKKIMLEHSIKSVQHNRFLMKH
jgi:hypothetical protein